MSIKWLRGSAAAGLALLVVFVTSGPAAALGNLQLNVAGEARGQTTLVLTPVGQTAAVQEDDDSDRVAGLWFWRDQTPGLYRVQVMRNGQPVGAPQTVEVVDGRTTTYRVDAQSGLASKPWSPAASYTPNLYLGVVGGGSRSPYSATVTSQALNSRDSGGLHDINGMIGLDARYYLTRGQQQLLGAGLFITGTYLHYLYGGSNHFFGDRHPTQGDDIGARARSRYAFMLGLGATYYLQPQLGLSLMLGAHATRMNFSGISDETGGNGEFNRFSRSRTMFGPFVGSPPIKFRLPLRISV